MHFSWARIRNIRLLKNQALMFHPQFNVIVGDNGAGKTTLLECLQILSRGSSTRGKAASLVSHGENRWSIRAGVLTDDAVENEVDIRWVDRTTQVAINGKLVGLGDLATQVPVLSITPHSHRLMEEGPGLRRRYMDWGVFHMEHHFYPAWRRLVRSLAQRNAAIRGRQTQAQVTAWNAELVAATDQVNDYRFAYIRQLEPVLKTELQALGDEGQWTLHLSSGWKAGLAYAEALEKGLGRDMKQGFTVEGAHRAELQLLRSDRNVRSEISRGQQKLLISGLILAQGKLYQSQRNRSPALLVDDLAAELSQQWRERLAGRLASYPGQKFVTMLDSQQLAGTVVDHTMFHVEQGRLTRLN